MSSSSSSDESSSSSEEPDVDVGVNSAFYAIKAAMQSTLSMITVVIPHCDEKTGIQLQDILHHNKMMIEVKHVAKPLRLAYLDDWKRLGKCALETFGKMETAHKTMENNMKKLKSVEELYGKKKTKRMVRAARRFPDRSTIVKAKSDARVRASKEKSQALHRWHVCMKTARKNLEIPGNTFPKKGTPLYLECTRLMAEKT